MVPPSAPTDLRQLTGYLLRQAYVKANGAAQACVPDDLPLRELAALSALAEQQTRTPDDLMAQGRLGELCQISPTLTVRLVDDLETKGWVARERSASDRRVQALRLTGDGRAELDAQQRGLQRAEATLLENLRPAEVARLKQHLRTLLGDSPVLAAGPLADRAGYLVAHAHRQLRDEASRRMAGLALHPRDFGLLTVLAEEQPCSQARLAARLRVSPPAVLALLDALEAQDLVHRVRSEADRRAHDVTLTSHGRLTLGRARRIVATIHGEIVGRLGPEGDADLRLLLQRLIADPA